MDEALRNRVRRIYAAIDQTEETDFSKFKVAVSSVRKLKTLSVDFQGGMSDEERENLAYAAIYNVAHLHGHLRRWFKERGIDSGLVDRAIAGSESLKIVLDLAESDKHGPARRDGGRSGRNPRIGDVERFMRLEAGPQQGAWTGLRFDIDGTPLVEGQGLVVISATVAAQDGASLGDLNRILKDAVLAWERLFDDVGIPVTC